MQIYNSFEQLKNLPIEKLSDPNVFAQIEDIVLELEAEGIPDTAKKELLKLSNILSKITDEIVIKKYYHVICALRLMSLSKVSDQEKGKFLSENIIGVVEQPYANPQHWLKLIPTMYGADSSLRLTFQRICVEALNSSLNLLGKSAIDMHGEQAKPFVKHWIQDFIMHPSSKMEKSVLDETTYINQSANAKTLDPESRETLRKLLRIYDWCRFEMLKNSQDHSVNNTSSVITSSSAPIIPVPPVPKPPVLAPKPPAPVSLPSQQSDFDKKLSQASASSAHGQTLEALKHNLEVRGVDAVPTHGAVQPLPSKVRLTPQEIQREVNTPELPTHQAAPISMAPKPAMAAPKPPAPPAIRPPLTPHNSSLKPISVLDDLKKLDVSFLRQAPLPSQIANLKFAIINIAHGNKVLPYYAVNAFEQSPLFQAYLAHGSSRFAGAGATDNLSQQEFEAIADLRKELERL